MPAAVIASTLPPIPNSRIAMGVETLRDEIAHGPVILQARAASTAWARTAAPAVSSASVTRFNWRRTYSSRCRASVRTDSRILPTTCCPYS